MKEKIKKFLRKNEKELSDEIQRCKDQLAGLTPGSKEYKDVLECYEGLLDREKELKKISKDIEKYIWAGAIGIAGVLLYRVLIDRTGDPFFRDLAKGLLKIVHV